MLPVYIISVEFHYSYKHEYYNNFDICTVYENKIINIYRIILIKAYLVKMHYRVNIGTCLSKDWNCVKKLNLLNIKNNNKKNVKISLTIFFHHLITAVAVVLL